MSVIAIVCPALCTCCGGAQERMNEWRGHTSEVEIRAQRSNLPDESGKYMWQNHIYLTKNPYSHQLFVWLLGLLGHKVPSFMHSLLLLSLPPEGQMPVLFFFWYKKFCNNPSTFFHKIQDPQCHCSSTYAFVNSSRQAKWKIYVVKRRENLEGSRREMYWFSALCPALWWVL